MKGQIEPITLILISSVIVSLVGAAYFWGIPVIQKRTAISEFDSGANFMMEMDRKVVDIANTGGGRETVAIPNGFARVVPHDSTDPDANSIILEVLVDQPMLVLDQEIPVSTTTLEEVGVFGVNEPRAITVKQTSFATSYKLIFKLHYIELDTAGDRPKGFRIALQSQSQSPGGEKATASFNNNLLLPGQAANGGDLTETLVDISIL